MMNLDQRRKSGKTKDDFMSFYMIVLSSFYSNEKVEHLRCVVRENSCKILFCLSRFLERMLFIRLPLMVMITSHYPAETKLLIGFHFSNTHKLLLSVATTVA